MPELPEAETIARGLDALVRGRRLLGVRCLRGGICDRQVAYPIGDKCSGVRRHAKKVILDFAGGSALLISLGMTGQVREREKGPLPPHTHLILKFEDREIIYVDPRRLGRLDPARDATTLLAKAEDVQAWCERRFGPDALSVSWPAFRELVADRRTAIKQLLLDQKVIAGVGNIYADEVLFRAGVHPQSRAADLPASTLRRLHAALRRVLNDAIRARGTTFRNYLTAAGVPGEFARRLWVYGREGQSCRRCGAEIARIQWPAGRSSCFCPRCQPRKGSDA